MHTQCILPLGAVIDIFGATKHMAGRIERAALAAGIDRLGVHVRVDVHPHAPDQGLVASDRWIEIDASSAARQLIEAFRSLGEDGAAGGQLYVKLGSRTHGRARAFWRPDPLAAPA